MRKSKLFTMTLACLLFGTLSTAHAEDFKEKVKNSMKELQTKLKELGEPKLEGMGTISGKSVPVLYFGSEKINEKYKVVDLVKKNHGGTATVFVKSGDDYIRVSTNVMKDAESRAIGTPLAKNPAYEAISKGQSFFGQVDILGKPYETGYEPIKNAKGETIGIFYVGYMLTK